LVHGEKELKAESGKWKAASEAHEKAAHQFVA
jgi:hypothetical protein